MKYRRGTGSLILGILSPLQFDDSIAVLANQNYLILVTEAARTLAVAAGVAASAIRRMSPFLVLFGALDLWSEPLPSGSSPLGSNIIIIDGWSLLGRVASLCSADHF